MESENIKIVRQFLDRNREAQDRIGYESLEFIDAPPDKVVVVMRFPTDSPTIVGFVFPIDDDKVGRWKAYPSKLEAMKAAGL